MSVLEAHHIAAAFELMLGDSKNNWAVQMPTEDFDRIRQIMIDCVLATDMTMHMKEFSNLKNRVTMPDYSLSNEKDKLAVIKYAFHLADISNPIKQWDLCKDWTDLLFVEFFAQGDMERLQSFP